MCLFGFEFLEGIVLIFFSAGLISLFLFFFEHGVVFSEADEEEFVDVGEFFFLVEFVVGSEEEVVVEEF